MILEGIVTTTGADGGANISPMGPLVDDAMRQIVLRPYRSSTTYRNLLRHGEGVLHVTDDVDLLARAAVGVPDSMPKLVPATSVQGWIIADACRWYAFRVREVDESQERVRIAADVIDHGRVRDFFGFNRAKHAVVEAAILATRIEFLPADEIDDEMQRLALLVQKTGGPQERGALEFLREHIDAARGLPASRIKS